MGYAIRTENLIKRYRDHDGQDAHMPYQAHRGLKADIRVINELSSDQD